jgi:hypothetical protein
MVRKAGAHSAKNVRRLCWALDTTEFIWARDARPRRALHAAPFRLPSSSRG